MIARYDQQFYVDNWVFQIKVKYVDITFEVLEPFPTCPYIPDTFTLPSPFRCQPSTLLYPKDSQGRPNT